MITRECCLAVRWKAIIAVEDIYITIAFSIHALLSTANVLQFDKMCLAYINHSVSDSQALLHESSRIHVLECLSQQQGCRPIHVKGSLKAPGSGKAIREDC